MPKLAGKTIVILATHGFEQSELEFPLKTLREHGATVHVASPEKREIKGWDQKNWGAAVPVDKDIEEIAPADYDALVLPGGQMNPDTLRGDDRALTLISSFFAQRKVIAAICHAPWLLIDTGIAKGRKLTSYRTIRQDLLNAGADWRDEPVVTDEGVVTSRDPDDLEAFVAKIAEEIGEGEHARRAA